jgi:ATP-binding cassette, subfamily B, multidrug efflux pump
VLTRFLLTHLRPYTPRVALLSILNTVQILCTLLLPTVNAYIVNEGVVKGDMALILRSGALMVAVTFVQAAAQSTAVFATARVAAAAGRDLRSRLFRRVQDFSERDVGTFGTPSLVTRSVNDVDQIQVLTVSFLDNVVPVPVTIIGSFAMAVSLDIPMSLLLVAAMAIVTVSVLLVLARMGPWYGRMQQHIDRINHILREQITGVQVIRAFVSNDRERARFRDENARLRHVSHRVGMQIAVIPPIIMLTMNVFSVIVLYLGAGRIDSRDMEPGTLAALLSYMGFCVMAITMAMIMFANVPRARVSAARISEVLGTATSVPPPSKAVNDSITLGSLELRSVTFLYPGAKEPVLRNIDLIAKPGQMVGVLGSTGSGKTTLLNLVIRLFDATGGAVLVNGVDVRLIDPDVLPGMVALVPQTPYLFSGTVESNLRFGRPDCTEAELWHALEVVQAREFVENLPQGLRTPTDQGGSELSGGQRQRLAIARALLCRADIYLLDDCFSALDFVTAAAVQAALAKELSSATVLMVAQRVATVQAAERIIVLDEGRVVGTGTHEELQCGNETYREIARSQFAGIGANR